MTLCIAAACRDGKKDRVVIGTDWRIEGGIAAGADIQDKLYWINDDIAVLVSGVVTRAVELRDVYRNLLSEMRREKKYLTYLNIRRFIRNGARTFKRQLSDEVTTFAAAMGYQEFKQAVRDKEIPEVVAIPIYGQIAKQSLECAIIVIAFLEKIPYIFQVERDGDMQECDNFATVGDGAGIAEGTLYLRKQESSDSLDLTSYHVYEAMHMARLCVSSVGKQHTINVLYPPEEKGKHVMADFLTNKAGFEFMREQYKKFGMKKIDRKRFPKLPEGSLKKESL